MTMDSKTDHKEALDADVLEMLGRDPAQANMPAQSLARVRKQVMSLIDAEESALAPFETIRADEGKWIELEPLIEKKVLSVSRQTGIESYLLRLHPGASPPRHHHHADELCVVLEGDVSFEADRLYAGDYHLARKGSWHGRANTINGALLFIQTLADPAHAAG